VHTCNWNTCGEGKAGGLKVQGQPGLHSETVSKQKYNNNSFLNDIFMEKLD
jgi:hypothetical protein